MRDAKRRRAKSSALAHPSFLWSNTRFGFETPKRVTDTSHASPLLEEMKSLTPQQVESYRCNGFLFPVPALTPDEVAT